MTPFKRLLAATDLSAPARHAAERAALLARELGASLDLLHVVNPAPIEKLRQLVADMPAEVGQRVLDATRDELRELGATVSKHQGVTATVRVTTGPLIQDLCAHAQGVDLLVLGARGSSFMRHLLLGSTAERMLRKTPRPMLVVKQPPHEPYRSLLVPVDFSAYSLRAVRAAQAVSPGANIVLLHAFEVPVEGKLRLAGVEADMIHRYRIAAKQDALAKLRQLCADTGLAPETTRFVVVHGDASRNIVEQEQEHDCDLIVVGKHGESAVEDLLLGSVTKHVLAESQCDVLVTV